MSHILMCAFCGCVQYKGVFAAGKMLGLWERLSEEERLRYPFALHQIDWEDYLWKIHLPGIRKCVRA